MVVPRTSFGQTNSPGTEVTEACLGGNLMEWLPDLKGQETLIRRIAQEVTGVLAHCHSRIWAVAS